ncbi:MAG TPA: NepR family anti-sigma factor [Rhizorhapis sp.]|nr:NepR family anti-sigma factor [Rhizorhapis sp.]
MNGKGRSNAGEPSSERTPPGKSTHDAPKDPALGDGSIGNALRSVYQQTIDEDIPTEMIDLLKKLS